MPRTDRVEIIRDIESRRQSRVITYICSSRRNATAQIADDAVRVMYDLVRAIGHVPKIDLFLYSHGGIMEIPWRIICTLREYCDELAVLIPYHAHSAATLIAMGCDEIVMGAKAELGAIDPALPVVTQAGGTVVQQEIRIEDVMSYIDFLKKKVEISDAETLGKHAQTLAEKLPPWMLGQIYRTHSHIRAVAQKMLESHRKPLAQEVQSAIVMMLAEETRSHGHGISRKEAKDVGLNVIRPDEQLESLMWQLFENYETASAMRDPLEPVAILGNRDESDVRVIVGWLESADATWAFRGDAKIKRHRVPTPNYDIKVSFTFGLNLTPPPGVDLQNIPAPILGQLQQNLSQQLQSQLPQHLQSVPDQVREIVRRQSPVKTTEIQVIGKWVNVTHEGI